MEKRITPSSILKLVAQHPADATSRAPLRFGTNGIFRIVQFTDLHFTNGGESDDRTARVMEEVLDIERPDLAVFTGDMIAGRDSADPAAALRRALRAVQARGMPFAAAFGNHDDEGSLSRCQLLEVLQGIPGNLTEAGPVDLPGVGNYMLSITGCDGRPAAALHFVDSHGYAPPETGGYAWITAAHGHWHRQVCQDLERERPDWRESVPELCFFHIPLPEYALMARSGHFQGVQLEEVACPKFNSGFFDALKNPGHVQGIFCGHDHLNDIAGEWEGLSLCYGRGGGFGTYGRDDFPKGARLIQLAEGQRGFETWIRLENGARVPRGVCAGQSSGEASETTIPLTCPESVQDSH